MDFSTITIIAIALAFTYMIVDGAYTFIRDDA